MVIRLEIFVLLLISSIIGFPGSADCFGQQDYNSLYYYRFYLKDKGGLDRVQIPVSEFLSERSLSRRLQNGITVDNMDFPIHKPYADTLTNRGLTISCRSKWLNTITASSEMPINHTEFIEISFIDSIKLVKTPTLGKGIGYNKSLDEIMNEPPPPYSWQLEMHGGDKLHYLGARGEGKIIAILDAGFSQADIMESVSDLLEEDRVLATYDFVLGDEFVFDFSQHGTAVFSIMAGDWPGNITGSAPGASYILLRSEDVYSEYLIEEDFWVAAAEYADSAGADIITTSLGYSLFSDSNMDHNYSEMNGESIYISRGADIAFSRGIVVVTSAGNERDDPWFYITAPADSHDVIAVGAVDGHSNISIFSSSGPTFDQRIKPDVSTMGVAVTIQRAAGSVTTGNGTSYACPLLSGMIACLMQIIPDANHVEIRDAVKISADRYVYPDNLYGFGVANIFNAYSYLVDTKRSDGTILKIYPNPTRGELYIRNNEAIEYLSIRIFDSGGRVVFEKVFRSSGEPIIAIPEFLYLDQGVYIVKVSTPEKTRTEKIIKLK